MHVCVCMHLCVCVAKPVAVELRCRATALIAYAKSRFSHDSAHIISRINQDSSNREPTRIAQSVECLGLLLVVRRFFSQVWHIIIGVSY